MADASMQFNPTRPDLPALFKRQGLDAAYLDRKPDAGEALAQSGYFDALEAALVAWDRAVAQAQAIQGDSDMTSDGKRKRIEPLLGSAQREADAAFESAVGRVKGALGRAQADVDGSSRPPSPSALESVVFELRVCDCRRQLERLQPGEVVGIVTASATSGDAVPLVACERSYIGLIPNPEVLVEARQELGRALNAPAALAVELNLERLEVAERYSALCRAQIQQTARGFDVTVPATAAA